MRIPEYIAFMDYTTGNGKAAKWENKKREVSMKTREKEQLLSDYEHALEGIELKMKGVPREALDFIPAIESAWSINEHLVHVFDADAICWYRLRVAIAEPGTTIPVWDQELWRSKLAYSTFDGFKCLEEATRLRQYLVSTYRELLNTDWSGYFVLHPERGRLDAAGILELYRDHPGFHLPYITRNLDAWKASGGA